MPYPEVCTRFSLGDRVRVNRRCGYQELIGTVGYVVALQLRPDLTVEIRLASQWPPRDARDIDDPWLECELELAP